MVLAWSYARPATEGSREVRRIGVSETRGDLRDPRGGHRQHTDGLVASLLVEDVLERHALLLQPALEGSRRDPGQPRRSIDGRNTRWQRVSEDEPYRLRDPVLDGLAERWVGLAASQGLAQRHGRQLDCGHTGTVVHLCVPEGGGQPAATRGASLQLERLRRPVRAQSASDDVDHHTQDVELDLPCTHVDAVDAVAAEPHGLRPANQGESGVGAVLRHVSEEELEGGPERWGCIDAVTEGPEIADGGVETPLPPEVLRARDARAAVHEFPDRVLGSQRFRIVLHEVRADPHGLEKGLRSRTRASEGAEERLSLAGSDEGYAAHGLRLVTLRVMRDRDCRLMTGDRRLGDG